MQSFIFSFNAIFPVFLLISMGYLLRKKNFINDNFIATGTKVVFRIALPVFIFRNIARTDFYQVFNIQDISISVSTSILFFALSWIVGARICRTPEEQGPFIQSSYRGNVAIIGTAIATNIYGPQGAAGVAAHLCFLMPLYNILSTIALTVPLKKEEKTNWGKIAVKIITNPLVISVIAALPFTLFTIPIPYVIGEAMDYTARLTLPLALLGIGGSLNFSAMSGHMSRVLPTGFMKLVLLPPFCGTDG